MQHTIYFGKRKLLVTSAIPKAFVQKELSPSEKIISIEKEGLKDVIAQVDKGTLTTAIVLHPQPEVLLESIKSSFHFIQAAGGLVLNNNKQLLLIYRKGKWDLPKGKLDMGEDLPTCAVREVMEETGLRTVAVSQPLGTTYHTYFQDGRKCLKESHWYLMHTTQTGDLVPQLEEDIEQCIWAASADLNRYLSNTHPSIADVVHEALPLLQQHP